ncbi:hypothetical protein [Microbacterium sp. NPDC089696]|uniref:hypothetical protein n=1 Tax=Microbacterium sp. NPDC089696 TaxID=3364199 RepID=UPI0037FFFF59
MNDKNPTPDDSTTPDAPTVPVAPASDLPTAPQTPIAAQPAPDAAAAPAPAATAAPKKTGLTRGLLIGGGIAAAVILVGGGIAVGAAIADDQDDDRAPFSDGPRDDDQDRGDRGQGQDDRPDGDDRRGDGTPEDGPGAGGQGGPVTGIGSASADEIVDVANAARGAADGEVTSIDAKRDGTWEVELTGSTGGETEVRVAADGTATVVSSDDEDDDDTAPAHTLDEAAIRALVAAALDEADGLITDLDADDDASSPYDVRVLTDDRRSIEIDLSADFAVVGTDTDD